MGVGKKQTVGYRYHAGMHMVLCHGPIDKLTRIRVDERIAWEGESTGGAINIDADSLFGGDSREGGVKGQVDFETGHAAQTPNSYLVSKLGALVPAFRGVAALILRQVYLGMNPYLKKWDARCQRIDVRQDGIAQWYPGKAKVPIRATEYSDTVTIPASLNLSWSGDQWDGSHPSGLQTTSAAQPPNSLMINTPFYLSFYNGGVTTGILVVEWAWGFVNAQFQGYVEMEFQVVAGTTHHLDGEVWVISAGATIIDQSITKIGVTPTNGFGIFSVVIKAYVHIGDFIGCGARARRDNNDFVNFDINAWIMYITMPQVYPWLVNTYDMNPAHIIRECLTDPLWGMGYLDADIDDVSFMAAADTLHAEEYGISLLWDTETSIEEFIKTIVKHIDASVYVDRKTGKFELKLIRNDYNPASLLVLNESNVEKITDFKRPSLGELTNSVTVTYWNNETGEDATLTVQDIALSQQQQSTVGTSVKYEGITNPYIASRVAQRDLKTLSTPLASCTIYANRDAAGLNVSDVFKLTWPNYDLANMVMRVTGIAYGDGRSHRVRIQCVEDVFAMPDSAVIVPPPTEWQDTGQAPVPITKYVVFEVPYFEMVQQQGQQAVDALLAGNPDMGFVGAGAARPQGGALSARIFTDMGNGYDDAANLDFSPCAVLDENIDQMATTFAIRDAQDIDSITLGTWFQIGTELMSVEAITESSITVKRGVLDTVPVPHSDGDSLIFWDVYGEADPTEYVASEQIDIKLLTVTGSGMLGLADAPQDTVTLDSRAIRPYPPGNMKINDEYFPEEAELRPITEDIEVTYASRNRLQQTGGNLVGFTDGNVTPEDDTEYSIRLLLLPSLAEIYAADNIAGLSHAFVPDYGGSVRLELWATRDGYASYQKQVCDFFLDDSPPPAAQALQWVTSGSAPNATLSNSNRTFTSGIGATAVWHKAKGHVARVANTGSYYFEIVVDQIMVTPSIAIGVAVANTATTSAQGGTDNAGDGGRYQYFQDGRSRANGSYNTYGASFTQGDVIGVSMQVVSGNTKIRFYKNGVDQGEAFSISGAAGNWEPHICVYTNTSSYKGVLTFPSLLAYLPGGFVPWN